MICIFSAASACASVQIATAYISVYLPTSPPISLHLPPSPSLCTCASVQMATATAGPMEMRRDSATRVSAGSCTRKQPSMSAWLGLGG